MTTTITNAITRGGSRSSPDPAYLVLQAVGECRDLDPLLLEEPLHDAIDPDSLATLWRPGTVGELTFEYAGCRVTVRSDGTVEAEPVTD